MIVGLYGAAMWSGCLGPETSSKKMAPNTGAPSAPATSMTDKRLTGEVSSGQWFYKGPEIDGPMALYGPPQSEGIFYVHCPDNHLLLEVSGELPDGLNTTTLTVVFPHGEGHFKAMAQEGEAPYISSALPLDDPFVALMAQTAAQPDSRIFITTPHTANLLLPTHAHLAKTLTACLGKLPAAKKG